MQPNHLLVVTANMHNPIYEKYLIAAICAEECMFVLNAAWFLGGTTSNTVLESCNPCM